MSIEHPQSGPPISLRSSLLRPSHRTFGEQGAGLGIYLILGLASSLLFAAASHAWESFFSSLYFLSLTFGMWTLWRRYSLRVLKLELSLFLAQFLFYPLWSISFAFHELLALVVVLLLWSNTLLAAFLFWKKEKLSGSLLGFPVLWTLYLVGFNMMICMRSSC